MFSGQRPIHFLLIAVLAAGFVPSAFSQSSDSVHIIPRSKVEKSSAPSTPERALFKRSNMRVNVDVVLVPVTVFDLANRTVTSLERDNFELYEDGEQQPLRYFSNEDSPVSVGVLMDLSNSMTDKIDTARQALNQFFDNANPDDDYFVIGFSDRPTLLADSSERVETIESELALAVPSGHTALLDAIYMGLNKLRTARYKRRALVIISDGGDNHSRYTARETRRLVQEADVEIYALGIFSKVFKTYEEWAGKRLLTEITEATGGRTVTINNLDELPGAAADVSRELRHQYILGYRPGNGPHGAKWHKIKVKVVPTLMGKGLHVYSKQGYLGPEN